MITRILGGSVLAILVIAIGISTMIYALDYGDEKHVSMIKCWFQSSSLDCNELSDLDKKKLAVMEETEALQEQAAELAGNIEKLEKRESILVGSIEALAEEEQEFVVIIADLKSEKEAIQASLDDLETAKIELVETNESLRNESREIQLANEDLKLQQERKKIEIEKLEVKAESYEFVFANLDDRKANLDKEVASYEQQVVFLEDQVTSLETMITFRENNAEMLRETIVVLQNDVDDLSSKKDFLVNYARFESLQTIMNKDLGNMSVFRYYEIPGTNRKLSVGTEYTDILSAEPKHTKYWCYINLKEKGSGLQESLYIRGNNGFIPNPDFTLAGLDEKDVSFAKSKCEPYNLVAH